MAFYNSFEDFKDYAFNAFSPGARQIEDEDTTSTSTGPKAKLFEPKLTGDTDSTSSTSFKKTSETPEEKGLLERISYFLWPEKKHKPGERYGTANIFIRLLFGSDKHEIFDLMHMPTGGLKSTDRETQEYLDEILKWNYVLKETFFIGYGPNAGEFNWLALLNPLNYFRVIDNFLIMKGLNWAAYAKKSSDVTSFGKVFWRIASAIFLIPGSLVRILFRALPQFIIGSTVRPLWSCCYSNYTNQQLGKRVNGWGWLAATVLTAVNVGTLGFAGFYFAAARLWLYPLFLKWVKSLENRLLRV